MIDPSYPFSSVCVYCGSADGVREEYTQAAYQMGQTLAQAGLHLVFGAGKTGLMGAVANGALAAGGQVTGVVPTLLNRPQLIHTGLTNLEVVDTIHQRKARMIELAGAFIALPGGYGTLEELFENLTWAQIGLHSKPIGLLNTLHYYDPLLHLVEHALQEKFIYDEHRTFFRTSEDPQTLLRQLRDAPPPPGENRWVNRA